MNAVATVGVGTPARKLPPGIYEGLPAADYHAMTDLVSKSQLDRVAQSPMHYRHSLTEPFEQTESMLLGSALHCMMLEPHLFASEYRSLPKDAPRDLRHFRDAKKPGEATIESCAWWDAWDASTATTITAEQMGKVTGMCAALNAHPFARGLFRGRRELTIVFDEPHTGMRCKARLDVWNDHILTAVDLKKTVSAAPREFANSCGRYRYHVQQAFYTAAARAAGLALEAFAFVAVESDAPHAVMVYELDNDAVRAGEALYVRDLLTIKRCRESGHWPGYSDEPMVIPLPQWSLAA